MPLPTASPFFNDPMYLTLEEVRASTTWAVFDESDGVDLSFDGPYNDQQIINMIKQASRKMDGCMGDTHVLTTRWEEIRGTGSSNLRLRHYPVWQGLQTTLATDAPSGSTVISLNNVYGIQSGKYIFFATNPEAPNPYVSGDFIQQFYPGQGSITLAKPLVSNHYSGELVIVRGIDFVMIQNGQQPVFTDISESNIQYSTGMIQEFNYWMYQRQGQFGNGSAGWDRNVPFIVQYTSGYTPQQLPPPLKQACLDLMVYQVTARRGGGIERAHRGNTTIQYANNPFMKGLPQDICNVLYRFSRGTGIF